MVKRLIVGVLKWAPTLIKGLIMKHLWNKLLERALRKMIDSIMTEENLKMWATQTNKKIDIPVLSEIQEQELIEKIYVEIGLSLKRWILGSE